MQCFYLPVLAVREIEREKKKELWWLKKCIPLHC